MADTTSDSDRLRALGRRLQSGVRERYETEKRMPYGYKLRQYERPIKSYKRGGRVHRTGIYKLHRGERVIPARSRRARRR